VQETFFEQTCVHYFELLQGMVIEQRASLEATSNLPPMQVELRGKALHPRNLKIQQAGIFAV
tara:strand:+ start:1577 stop:1762 length:186 start_codon:yes stop_codon:yes gene_type:complete